MNRLQEMLSIFAVKDVIVNPVWLQGTAVCILHSHGAYSVRIGSHLVGYEYASREKS